MPKLTLSRILSQFGSITKFNNNSELIEGAIENTLSRDGTSPNEMLANLDMNEFRVINLDDPVDNTDAANKQYVDGAIETAIDSFEPIPGDDGADGATPTIAIGTVTTGAAGSSASVDITGSSPPDYTFNFTIPRGDTGASGAGSGDVTGPASSTDNGLVRFDGTTGKVIQDSPGITVTDVGQLLTFQASGSQNGFYAAVTGDANGRAVLGLNSTSEPILGFGSGVSSRDLFLTRDAANTLAQRNGTNAQTFRVYGTYTDSSNYERISVVAATGNHDITTERAGTGVPRALRLYTTGATSLRFGTNNAIKWNIDSTGHILAETDNTYDIGASGATRPRHLYVGTNVTAGGSLQVGSSSAIYWSSRALLRSPSDGAMTLSNLAETNSVTFTVGASNALSVNGAFTASGYITSNTGFVSAAAGPIQWSGRSALTAPSDGVLRIANNAGTNTVDLTVGASNTLTLNGVVTASDFRIAGQTVTKNIESIIIAVGDETTAITTGNAKVTFRMPYAFTLTSVRASLTTASSSGIPTVDINEGGVSILSTKLTIDANEKTSTTAATAAVISDTSLADDAEITIDIDVAGTGAAGLKVYLIGRRT